MLLLRFELCLVLLWFVAACDPYHLDDWEHTLFWIQSLPILRHYI